MNRLLAFVLVAVFAIFLGSQITEGLLLLPYWKSLPANEFYGYYAEFGPKIGQFYTILTIIAAVIPLLLTIYCLVKKSPALRYAVVSTVFAIAFISFFYIYFKGANQQFLEAALEADQLKTELQIWGNWHWIRVGVEFLSLGFLILALNGLVGKQRT